MVVARHEVGTAPLTDASGILGTLEIPMAALPPGLGPRPLQYSVFCDVVRRAHGETVERWLADVRVRRSELTTERLEAADRPEPAGERRDAAAASVGQCPPPWNTPMAHTPTLDEIQGFLETLDEFKADHAKKAKYGKALALVWNDEKETDEYKKFDAVYDQAGLTKYLQKFDLAHCVVGIGPKHNRW